MNRHACHTEKPIPHPWEDIKDMACGYQHRLTDLYCRHCHRSREQGPEDQLREHKAMGRAAKSLEEANA